MIYVDTLARTPVAAYHGDAHARRVGAKNGHRWAHMVSDSSDEELHAFAKKVGLDPDWFQGDHYDLTPVRHANALRLGAKVITRRELVAIIRARRAA